MRLNKLLLLLFFILLLQACLPTTQLEKSAIINMRGIDLLEEGGETIFEVTIIPFVFDPEAQTTTDMLSGKGKTIKEAGEDAGNRASFELTPGAIRLELFGRAAAEKGIIPLLNSVVRDARASEVMFLVFTNQTAKEVLEIEQSEVAINTSQYLEDLVNKEIQNSTLPINSLHYIARTIEQVGIDPVLPVIDLVENYPTLVGAALLRGDKYVEEVSLQESFLINQMRRKVSKTSLHASVPLENYRDKIAEIGESDFKKEEESIHVFLSLVNGKGKLKLVNQESMHYKAEIKMEVELLETSVPLDVKTRSIAKKLEEDIAQSFTKQYEALFSKLQEVNSDAFGLGKLYSSTRKGSKLTDEQWLEQFPETTIEFDIEFTIVNTGTID